MKFSNEQKQQLVARYYNGESVSDICLQSRIARSTLYSWIKPYKTTITKSGLVVSVNEFARLKKKLEKAEQKIEVLQQVNCTSSSPLRERLNELTLLYGKYSVRVLCEALEVDRGTFYNHIYRSKKANSWYQIRRMELSEQIRKIYDESNQIYGSEKIKAVLSAQGVAVSYKIVAELMDEMNIQSIRIGSKKNYDRFNREKKRDSLKMNFSATAPNRIWVSDVTYFKLNGKMHYICAIVDLYSRKVVAHKISKKHTTQLITATFKIAYAERQPANGLIFHSDRGAQYTSYRFQKLLKSCHIKQSFSPSGRPQHNAVMESFFASMKKEELYRTNYHSINEFKERVIKYINFYNNERPHSTLNFRTPNAYEHFFHTNPLLRKKLDKGV